MPAPGGESKSKRPMPADFPQVHQGKNVRELQRIYKAGGNAIARWLMELGIDPRTKGNKPMILPANIAALCESYGVRDIARMIGWSSDTLRAKLKKEHPDLHAKAIVNGYAKRANNGRDQFRQLNKKTKLVEVAKRRATPFYHIKIKRHDDSAIEIADKARAYLQRFGACFSDAYSAQPGRGGYWFMGQNFTADALIAEAYRRGWKPDGWKELAA